MKIPIVLICDDNYIIPTSVAISSMISSKAPETYYEIYIVCASLSEESEAAFSVFASDSVAIHILREDAERFASLHVYSKDAVCVASPAALLKFALPGILADYDKVLYLDGDILVRGDLSELYSVDLGENLVAAVMDSSALYKTQYQFVPDYFNSGVMVLNLAKMREEDTTAALIQAKQEHNVAYFMDQNAFNYVCSGRIKLLPIRYNLLAVVLDKARDKWSPESVNEHYGTSYTSQDEILQDGFIIHFASKDKPWKNPFVLYAKEWFKQYKLIPLSHTLPDFPSVIANMSVTISLTSYPGRISGVSEVIDCLSRQSVAANRVLLYLAKEQFPERENELPERLLEQVQQGQVEICWRDLDLKSHKKYFYAMQEYPNDVIVTVDDDEYLPDTMLEELLVSYLHNPDEVSARRTHLITFDGDGNVLPYQKWINAYNGLLHTPSMQLVAVGCSGVLYPPHLLPPEAFDMEAIMSCAPHADDLWLKAHEAMNGIPVILVTAQTSLHHVEDSQEIGLYQENQLNGGNDIQFEQICQQIDKQYGGTHLLVSRLCSTQIGVDLTGTEPLIDYILQIRDSTNRKLRAQRKKLQQTYAEKSEINRKLQITYGEKFDRGVQIRELKAQLNAAKKAQADLKMQLNQTKKQLKASKKQNAAIKRSTSYRLGRILTWPVRRLKRLWKRLKRQ